MTIEPDSFLIIIFLDVQAQQQGINLHHQVNTQMAFPSASQMSPNVSFHNDQLTAVLEQQGQNIFGLTPMQLQQLLLVQMQMAQLQNSSSGNRNNSQVGLIWFRSLCSEGIYANTELEHC